MIQAVIFDFNGVILDDEHLHFAMFQEILAQEGVHITEKDYHDTYLGLDDRGCFETALSNFGQSADASRLDDMIARKAVRYFEEAARGLKFFPGAAESLAGLARRWPLAINSGALRPEIEFALKLINSRDHILTIGSAEETSKCKPDPEGYTLALGKLHGEGHSSLLPGHCVVIEDSLAGIQSAKGAGMWAVGVPNTYQSHELLSAGADDVVPSLVEFTPEWIESRFEAWSKKAAEAGTSR